MFILTCILIFRFQTKSGFVARLLEMKFIFFTKLKYLFLQINIFYIRNDHITVNFSSFQVQYRADFKAARASCSIQYT